MYKFLYKEKNNNYIVYLDMDGVLCDFVKSYQKNFNKHPHSIPKKESAQLINSVPNWYAKLSWMSGGKDLFTFVNKNFYTIKILTTPFDSVKTCKQDKIDWIKREIGNLEVIFSSHKEDYANSKSILIDDMDYNVEPFVGKGGVGILHVNAKDSIKKLQEFI